MASSSAAKITAKKTNPMRSATICTAVSALSSKNRMLAPLCGRRLHYLRATGSQMASNLTRATQKTRKAVPAFRLADYALIQRADTFV